MTDEALIVTEAGRVAIENALNLGLVGFAISTAGRLRANGTFVTRDRFYLFFVYYPTSYTPVSSLRGRK